MVIGIDVENINRFENYTNKINSKKIFTENEFEYCTASIFPAEHFAGFFCAKEAVKKALCSLQAKLNCCHDDDSCKTDCFCTKLNYGDIEICHTKSGAPSLVISEKIKSIISKCELKDFEISISHTKEIATAICIIN